MTTAGSRSLVRAHLAIGFSIVIWGTTFVAIKYLVTEISPLPLVSGRFLLSAFLFGLVAFRFPSSTFAEQSSSAGSRSPIPGLSWNSIGILLFLGVTGLFVHQWVQAEALRTTLAVSAGWLIATVPVFTALLARLFLKEPFTPIMGIGTVVAVLGTLLVVGRGVPLASLLTLPSTTGDLLILASAVNWAVNSLLGKIVLRRLSPMGASALSYLVTAVPLFPFFLRRDLWEGLSQLSPTGWLILLHLVVGSSVVAQLAWCYGHSLLPAAKATAYLYVEPLSTMAAAALFLGEPLGPEMLVGGLLILGGVALVNWQPRADSPPLPDRRGRVALVPDE